MPKAAAALVLAGLTACAGYTNGTTNLGDGSTPVGGGGSDGGTDGGDGGTDGGDAGPDAGCAPLTLNTVPAVDGCPGPNGLTSSAQGTVNTANCTIDITLSTGTVCSGAVSGGTANAFDGGCQSNFYHCTSSSLPGTLNCSYGSSLCAIKICDAGASCP